VWRALALTFLIAFSASTAFGAAAEDPEQLIKLGNDLRRKGDDARAHGYFQRAYEIGRTPRTAAQLGLADQSVGEYLAAEEHLSEALETGDPWVREHRQTLQGARATVREHLGQISLVGLPADATLAIAGGAPRKVPADGVVWVSPGETSLHLEAGDREPVIRTVTVAAKQNLRLEIGLPARKSALPATPPAAAPATATATPTDGSLTAPSLAPPPAAEPPAAVVSSGTAEHPGRTGRIVGIAVAGVGVGLDVAGVILRGTATSKLNAIQNESAKGTNYDPQYGNWQTYDRASVGLLVAGTAAIAAGAAIFFLNLGHDSESDAAGAHVSMGFAPGAGGGTLHLGGRF
jgi:hypothetical protein